LLVRSCRPLAVLKGFSSQLARAPGTRPPVARLLMTDTAPEYIVAPLLTNGCAGCPPLALADQPTIVAPDAI
jgi:hypothetical protein